MFTWETLFYDHDHRYGTRLVTARIPNLTASTCIWFLNLHKRIYMNIYLKVVTLYGLLAVTYFSDCCTVV